MARHGLCVIDNLCQMEMEVRLSSLSDPDVDETIQSLFKRIAELVGDPSTKSAPIINSSIPQIPPAQRLSPRSNKPHISENTNLPAIGVRQHPLHA